jgi:hypothetical protein
VWRNPGLLTGVRLDAAGYRNTSYEGDYQGLAPTLGFNHPRVAVMALLPAYRLTRNGRTGYGLGDLALAVRAPIPAFTRGSCRPASASRRPCRPARPTTTSAWAT